MAARSIYEAVLRVAATDRSVVLCIRPLANSSFIQAHQSRAIIKRHLGTVPPSSPTVSFPNTEHPVSNGSSARNTTVGQDTATTSHLEDENLTNNDSSKELLPFTSLNDRVNHNTIKALIGHPLQLTSMTPVQEHVTALLPGLARPWDPEGIVPPSTPNPLPPGWKPLVFDWTAPRDILVRAKTGTGKTFAYLIPAIELRLNHAEHQGKLAVINAGLERSPPIATRSKLVYRRTSAGPLILAPTRELAIQIARNAQKLTTHHKGFEVQLLVGGAGKARQMKDWVESTRDLVVATPGRLRDLLTNEPEFRQGFKSCPMLILDEADTLLSMGFRDDIDAIVSFLPRSPNRQTLFFSATMPRAVRQLASWILSPNHAFINAAQSESTSTMDQTETQTKTAVPCDDELTTHYHIEQFHTLCPTVSDQIPTLLKLLAHDQLTHGPCSKAIVFCPTIQTTDLFSSLLLSLAEEVLPDDTTEILTIHSKMKQPDRSRAQTRFHEAARAKNGKPTILVTSDVSARGLDYPAVTRVIQIGVPSKEAMYIHRIGRMARGVDAFAPKEGKEVDRSSARADLLLLPWEAGYMNWQLTNLPIKPLPISVLDSQLTSLSPSSSRLTEFLDSALAEMKQRIEPAGIRATAASLLGYYLPLAPALRLQPNAVLAGISSWASECFNVSIPAMTRFPKKFSEAYEESIKPEKKGLFVDGLRVAGASALGKAKSKNRSVWEGANTRKKKPKRWY